jgi:hypothetical protein
MEAILEKFGIRGHSKNGNNVLLYGICEDRFKSIPGHSKHVTKIPSFMLKGKWDNTAYVVDYPWYCKSGLKSIMTNIGGTKRVQVDQRTVIFIDYLKDPDEAIREFKVKMNLPYDD